MYNRIMRPKEIIIASQIRELEAQRSAERSSRLCQQEETERATKQKRVVQYVKSWSEEEWKDMGLHLIKPDYPDIVA